MQITSKTLEPIASNIKIELSVAVEPKDFYKDREGLHVWSDFTDRIVSRTTGPSLVGTEFSVDSFTLVERANDEEIESALPKDHIFSEDAVCAIIAEFIGKQPKGEEGALLNNGYANLFYTASFVVCVRRFGGCWRVCAWLRGGGAWGAGGRVFSPATVR